MGKQDKKSLSFDLTEEHIRLVKQFYGIEAEQVSNEDLKGMIDRLFKSLPWLVNK